MDRRAKRTRTALAEALIRLAPVKGFDAVKVEDLVRTARVARSTFYGHYADKADFVDQSYRAMVSRFDLRAREEGEMSILPVNRVFTHVKEAEAYARAMAASGAFDALMARRENFLAELAEANLARFRPTLSAARRKEASIMIAGAYTALLRWWLAHDFEPGPAEMQAWFDRFVDGAASG